MVPVTEITLSPGTIVVRAYNYRHMLEVCDFIKNTITCSVGNPEPISTKQNEEEYRGLVAKVLEEIGQEKYTKLIPSRVVKIERRVDMPATLLHGRRANTPKRSYSLNQCGFQATGFSPELVIAVEKHHVITGTSRFVECSNLPADWRKNLSPALVFELEPRTTILYLLLRCLLIQKRSLSILSQSRQVGQKRPPSRWKQS